jgi:hypothetical protein
VGVFRFVKKLRYSQILKNDSEKKNVGYGGYFTKINISLNNFSII